MVLVCFWSVGQGIRLDGGNPAKSSALHSQTGLLSIELLTARPFAAALVVAVGKRMKLVFVRVIVGRVFRGYFGIGPVDF